MNSSQSYTTLNYQKQGAIALIALNRPDKLNAINREMMNELHRAMDNAESDQQIRAIVVHGQGRAFSAGFDLSGGTATKDISAKREELEQDFRLIMRFWDSVKPTIAAVHGYCLGGALELAMACDITVASEDCRLGEPEPQFGSGIVALLMPWLIGAKQAKHLMLTGEDRLTAQRAYELGLVNQVCVADSLLDSAVKVAQRIAMLDRTAVKLTKQAINRSFDIMGMRQALLAALETDIIIETTETPESLEFNRVLQEQGLKSALHWRSTRFSEY